ncbi:hypothetical protein CJ030_MR6G021375 [Morella rubra]|uniref:NADH-ubiquinone reductase complex 1 MLRQ subunit n=1 Tax=Morella rubra TaxID=262757 RepID=A0A6A1VFU5_9ROSI|nr:hypothetical protein CJ030_MR6G021375 [Morella rubra]
MGRWMKPEIVPLLIPMAFVTGLCTFSLVRNILSNPAVRVNKAHRRTAVLDNAEEGERYVEHGFRKFLRTRSPEVFPTINRFFSEDK